MVLENLLQAVREVLGTPDFYVRNPQSATQYMWDYGAMLEYAICGILLAITITSIFKLIRRLMFG